MRYLPIALAVVLLSAGGAQADNWGLLGGIEIREMRKDGRWIVEKRFPPRLIEVAENFEVTGHFVPVQAQAYVRSFLLVPDPSACPFCGTGSYGPTLEVHMRKPMPDIAEGARITVRGALRFIQSDQTLQSVIMTDAVLIAH